MKRGWTANRVRALMEAIPLTEQGLADRLSVHQITVARWLQGKAEPTSSCCRTMEGMEKRLARRLEKAAK